MGTPVIIDAVRTPIGKKNGALAGVHAAVLLGSAQSEVISRAGIDAELVEPVIGASGEQLARACEEHEQRDGDEDERAHEAQHEHRDREDLADLDRDLGRGEPAAARRDEPRAQEPPAVRSISDIVARMFIATPTEGFRPWREHVLALPWELLVARSGVDEATIRRIAEHHPELGAHLDHAVRTGAYCAYAPAGVPPTGRRGGPGRRVVRWRIREIPVLIGGAATGGKRDAANERYPAKTHGFSPDHRLHVTP